MKFAAYNHFSIYAIADTPEAAIAKARDDARDDSAKFEAAMLSDEFAAFIMKSAWHGNHNSFEVIDGRIFDITQSSLDAFEAAVELMDDDIREAVHDEPDASDIHWFLAEYARRHEAKFCEPFAPATGGAW